MIPHTSRSTPAKWIAFRHRLLTGADGLAFQFRFDCQPSSHLQLDQDLILSFEPHFSLFLGRSVSFTLAIPRSGLSLSLLNIYQVDSLFNLTSFSFRVDSTHFCFFLSFPDKTVLPSFSVSFLLPTAKPQIMEFHFTYSTVTEYCEYGRVAIYRIWNNQKEREKKRTAFRVVLWIFIGVVPPDLARLAPLVRSSPGTVTENGKTESIFMRVFSKL